MQKSRRQLDDGRHFLFNYINHSPCHDHDNHDHDNNNSNNNNNNSTSSNNNSSNSNNSIIIIIIIISIMVIDGYCDSCSYLTMMVIMISEV